MRIICEGYCTGIYVSCMGVHVYPQLGAVICMRFICMDNGVYMGFVWDDLYGSTCSPPIGRGKVLYV